MLLHSARACQTVVAGTVLVLPCLVSAQHHPTEDLLPVLAQNGRADTTPLIAAASRAPMRLPLWEVGLGAVAVRQQAYPGSSVQINRTLALPYLIYRGKVLRAENGGVGLRAVRRPRFELDIGFAGAFGSGSSVPIRDGMPSIGSLGEVGPRLRIRLGSLDRPTRWRLNLPLRAVLDLSDQFSYRGLAFEPKLTYNRRLGANWRMGASLGVVVGDRRLADTFYGVDPAFARAGRPAYRASAGLITTRLGLSLSRRINRYLSLRVFARADSISGAANRDSPLVEQRNGYTAGIGLTWKWRESATAAHR